MFLNDSTVYNFFFERKRAFNKPLSKKMPLAVIFNEPPDSTCQYWPNENKDIVKWLKNQFEPTTGLYPGATIEGISNRHWHKIASAAFKWAKKPHTKEVRAGRLKFCPKAGSSDVVFLYLDDFKPTIGTFVIAARTH